ncbi:alpha/beta hydrolase family protein [Herbiconiux daphne]|uniref:Alpha/beta fold hydrolase n=1 Tax=Herbiconiux daphne TaxID=2970914 RepID=A0ABT2H6M6_9MICO|nr:alpha/beta fold hydrolase [Herbiconiux daphne]MCS5735590.1 alpha/beta fold hydrolase [Herbiconiux daphne]
MPSPAETSRRPRQLAVGAVLVALLAGLAGCTPAPAETPEPTLTVPTEKPVTDTSTLRTIIDSAPEQPTLTMGEVLDATDGVTSTAVTYDSGGLTISGVLRVPAGEGPFPGVVVVHGSVDPERYDTGGDLESEQRVLVANGYAVLATDLRGYGSSDPADSEDNLTVDPGFGWPTVLDWGMALDVVNALAVLRSGQVPEVDPDRIGLVGHSLGGLLALDAAVIAPGSSDMVVALSAATSSFGEVIEGYEASGADVTETTAGPTQDPEYWADVSPRTFFDRATEPLLLIHGGADDTALPEWSQETAAAWQAEGLEAQAVILDGADHALKPRRDEADELMLAAFNATIGPGGAPQTG